MKIAVLRTLTIGMVVLLVVGSEGKAAEVPAAPPTLLNLFGIPQGINKARDAVVNRSGKHPKLERTPPLKAIGDPAFLESDVPVLKVAAQAKIDADLQGQKIKGIRYLATIGCDCHEGVKEALLASLDDCDEAVRFEAAMAFCQTAGSRCKPCGGTCCAADVVDKLSEMAYARDATGCCVEPSQRVRQAAQRALSACRRASGSTPGEPGREHPVVEPAGEGPLAFAGDGESAGVIYSVSTATGQTIVDPINMTTVGRRACTGGCGKAGGCGGDATCGGAGAAMGPSDGGPISPDLLAGSPGGFGETFGATSGPQSMAPNMIGDSFGGSSSRSLIAIDRLSVLESPPVDNSSVEFSINPPGDPLVLRYRGAPVVIDGVAFATGFLFETVVSKAQADAIVIADPSTPLAVAEPTSITPSADAVLTGRNPGTAGATRYVSGTATLDNPSFPRGPLDIGDDFGSVFHYQYEVFLDIPSPGAGGTVGRLKIADNTSPIPRDRLIFDYHYFNNAALFGSGVDVNRFTLGLEKTFFDGMASFELKAPMATGLDSTVVADGVTGMSHGEFGNLGLTFKALLFQTKSWGVSAGLTVAAPTGDDTVVALTDGTPLVRIRNESVHLAPFLGCLWTPDDRFFAQGFFQVDVDPSGNAVSTNFFGSGLQSVGVLQDATLMYVDAGVGYWSYRCRHPKRRLTGVAWTAEVHWNRSLQASDVVTDANFTIGSRASTFEAVNLTLGSHLEFNHRTTLTLGYAVPLGGGQDRQFDGELRVMLN
ncbi:MAG: hypothetical protein HQ581_01015, partial [Planctomycetes bacterium]|nr:hypothetical protein [Planctomycetota bacterium]